MVPLELVVARSPHVVVMLLGVRAFSTGCMLDVSVLTRQREDWPD